MACLSVPVFGQLVDKIKAPNTDPFRTIRRGRQLFQRKFSRLEGLAPITGDGSGDTSGPLFTRHRQLCPV
jgi:hypothetical protein